MAINFSWKNRRVYFYMFPKQSKNEQALVKAIKSSDISKIRKIISLGVDLNYQTFEEDTFLSLAVEAENIEVINELINVGVDLNQKILYSYTALMNASAAGNLEIVKLLTSAGSSIDLISKDNKTAISLAIENGHPEVFEYLNQNSNFPVTIDIDIKREIDKRILRKREENFIHAAGVGNIELSKREISNNINVNAVNLRGETALYLAAYTNKVDIVDYLVQSGADINQKHRVTFWTPLMVATRAKQIEAIQLLVRLGADLEATDEVGCTAICLAIETKNSIMVNELILQGANINVIVDGYNLLQYAQIVGKTEVIDLLRNLDHFK